MTFNQSAIAAAPSRQVPFEAQPTPARGIATRTWGHGHGPITRLMSPSDLGQLVKPFVFLDIFDLGEEMLHSMSQGDGMPLHPHSGVATVTVFTEGGLRFDDPSLGAGTLTYGGVEWMRAGSGVWHGKELSPVPGYSRVQGFQLWLALPADVENGVPESRCIEASGMRSAGPASVIVGSYDGVASPVPAPPGVTYLLVTLPAGQRWTFHPPGGQAVCWLALAKGALEAGEPIHPGEMIVFEQSEQEIDFQAGAEDAVFVLGAAVPHPYGLHLGNYSVHTSAAALREGETRIAELGRRMKATGVQRTPSGTVPVLR